MVTFVNVTKQETGRETWPGAKPYALFFVVKTQNNRNKVLLCIIVSI